LQFFLFCNKVIIYIIVKNQYTCSYLEKKCWFCKKMSQESILKDKSKTASVV
jgi:phage FluMu protein Com